MKRKAKLVSIGTILFLIILGIGLVNTVTSLPPIYTFKGKVYLNGVLTSNKNVHVEVRARFRYYIDPPYSYIQTKVKFDLRTNHAGEYYISFRMDGEALTYKAKATLNGASSFWAYDSNLHSGINEMALKMYYVNPPDPNPFPGSYPGGYP